MSDIVFSLCTQTSGLLTVQAVDKNTRAKGKHSLVGWEMLRRTVASFFFFLISVHAPLSQIDHKIKKKKKVRRAYDKSCFAWLTTVTGHLTPEGRRIVPIRPIVDGQIIALSYSVKRGSESLFPTILSARTLAHGGIGKWFLQVYLLRTFVISFRSLGDVSRSSKLMRAKTFQVCTFYMLSTNLWHVHNEQFSMKTSLNKHMSSPRIVWPKGGGKGGVTVYNNKPIFEVRSTGLFSKLAVWPPAAPPRQQFEIKYWIFS